MQDTVVEVVVSSREEVNSMLTFDDFKKLQQNTVDATPNLISSGVTHGESPSASHPDMEQAAGVPPK
jgi:hypothetical protein